MGSAPLKGESLHEKGRDGARRAKKWLEATSRVDVCWVNPDKGAVAKLTCPWPVGGESFSFDLGGRLRYGDFDGELFYAEVKKYANSSDLSSHYREFLAKCYVFYLANEKYADNFVWLSWAPHATSEWANLTSAAKVRAAVIQHAKTIFPADADPETAVSDRACAEVSKRLWLLIVSDKQEKLVPDVEHLNLIHSHEMNKAATQ